MNHKAWNSWTCRRGTKELYKSLSLPVIRELQEGKDEAEAVKWFRKAAEQGDADAKAALRRLGYAE